MAVEPRVLLGFFLRGLLHYSSIDRDALLVHVREMAETARLNAERLPIQLESFLAQVGVHSRKSVRFLLGPSFGHVHWYIQKYDMI